MCDEKNNKCVENETNTQKIKIIKFDRTIPIIQLLALGGVLILLGVALVRNEMSRIFLTLGLMVILIGIVWRVGRVYRKGLAFEVQYVDEEHPTRLTLVVEEAPDTDEDSMSEEKIDEETEKETHWTEQNYPDPDVELGLKDPPKEALDGSSEEKKVIR